MNNRNIAFHQSTIDWQVTRFALNQTCFNRYIHLPDDELGLLKNKTSFRVPFTFTFAFIKLPIHTGSGNVLYDVECSVQFVPMFEVVATL